MNYINEQFDRLIQTEENRRIIEDMRRDVDSFLPNFSSRGSPRVPPAFFPSQHPMT